MIPFFIDRRNFISGFVPKDFQNISLNDIENTDQESIKAIEAVAGYINDVLNNYRRTALIIYGPSGYGKTLLSSCIWNEIAFNVDERKSYSDAVDAGTADNYCWINCAQLPDQWKQNEAAINHHYQTAFFAVLDDLDKCASHEAWGAQLYSLIDNRLCQRRLPTVITMNPTPAELIKRYGGTIGDAMFSRFERTGGLFVRLPKMLHIKPSDPTVNQALIEEEPESDENFPEIHFTNAHEAAVQAMRDMKSKNHNSTSNNLHDS